MDRRRYQNPAQVPPVFVDRAIFSTPLVTVGEFRCSVSHPHFSDSGPIREDCFVFPRLPVAIEHEHEAAFVANRNVVAFYNRGQAYRRAPISRRGDHCEWFSVDRSVVRDVLSSDAGDDGPFQWTHGPSDARTYLAQHNVVDAVRKHLAARVGAPSVAVDVAQIEEAIILILGRVVDSALSRRNRRPPRAYGRSTRDAVHHIEVVLSTRWHEPLSLSDLAGEAQLSAFHLCRAFRWATGRTLHDYRQQLRLRAALDAMRSRSRSLVAVALDAGFCSHSHFSSVFRREFGVTPSRASSPSIGTLINRPAHR